MTYEAFTFVSWMLYLEHRLWFDWLGEYVGSLLVALSVSMEKRVANASW